jgi:hypothetical protein
VEMMQRENLRLFFSQYCNELVLLVVYFVRFTRRGSLVVACESLDVVWHDSRATTADPQYRIRKKQLYALCGTQNVTVTRETESLFKLL